MDMAHLDPAERAECPCCGYPTLGQRGAYEICELCWWEDDGQGDACADEVRGGPNQGSSLAQARRNFRQFLVMYEPEQDPRVGGRDSEAERVAKGALMEAFDGLKSVSPTQRSAIIARIRDLERQLERELQRKIKEYEAQL
jgi:hypothetical protein